MTKQKALLEAARAAWQLITMHCPDCFGDEGVEVVEKLRKAIKAIDPGVI